MYLSPLAIADTRSLFCVTREMELQDVLVDMLIVDSQFETTFRNSIFLSFRLRLLFGIFLHFHGHEFTVQDSQRAMTALSKMMWEMIHLPSAYPAEHERCLHINSASGLFTSAFSPDKTFYQCPNSSFDKTLYTQSSSLNLPTIRASDQVCLSNKAIRHKMLIRVSSNVYSPHPPPPSTSTLHCASTDSKMNSYPMQPSQPEVIVVEDGNNNEDSCGSCCCCVLM